MQRVLDQIWPVAAFNQAVIVQRLPKTRSGKILRRTMQSIVNGDDFTITATIDDPDIIEEIADAVRIVGIKDSTS